MKKVLIILLGVVVVIILAFFGLRGYTKRYSPDAVASYDKNGLNINVKYCQPSKKNRVIFGGIVPFGKVWRTGANEITEITFKQDVSIANKPVKAGSYALFTIPNKEDWTLILNSGNRTLFGTRNWGTQYKQENDVYRLKVSKEDTESETEQFTIKIEDGKSGGGAMMYLMWDQVQVNVPIKKN